MIDVLIAHSIRENTSKWLKMLPIEMMDTLTKAAVSWCIRYEEKFGKMPSKTRYTGSAHGIIYSDLLVDTPIADIYEQAIDMLKKEHSLRTLREWKLMVEDGYQLTFEDLTKLGKALSTSANGHSQVISLEDWDWSKRDMDSFKLHFCLPSLDALTGGFRSGAYGILVGRPGVAKTQVLCHFAVDWFLKGKRVLLVSCELDLTTIVSRVHGILAERDSNVFIDGTPEEILSAKAAAGFGMSKGRELGGKLEFMESPVFADAVAEAASSGRYDVVLVDSFYLMNSRMRHDGEWHRIKSLSDSLRQATGKTRTSVFVTSQLKRTGKEAGFTLEDIAFSDAIGMTVDLALSMYLDGKETRVIEIMKNRTGTSFGNITVKFDWSKSKMEELSWS